MTLGQRSLGQLKEAARRQWLRTPFKRVTMISFRFWRPFPMEAKMKIRRLRSPVKTRRELTSQENQLWTEVTKQVVRSISTPRAPQRPALLKDRRHENVIAQPPSMPDPLAHWTPVVRNPGALIGRKTLRKLRRGVRQFDQTLDLHGMTQPEAHVRLKDFLIRSQANGAQLVLVITGRGKESTIHESVSGRGVLRRRVPEWLRSFRELVSGFEEAPPRLGGGGALFVRLRRFGAG